MFVMPPASRRALPHVPTFPPLPLDGERPDEWPERPAGSPSPLYCPRRVPKPRSWHTSGVRFSAGGTSIGTGTPAGSASGDAPSRFDLIASNPPYIAEGDSHLPALVHEPIEALTSGPDGLDDIRLIVAQSPACLRPGGWLLLEHGHDQAEAVTTLLNQRGFVNVQSRKDLAGTPRCTGGQWMPNTKEG